MFELFYSQNLLLSKANKAICINNTHFEASIAQDWHVH